MTADSIRALERRRLQALVAGDTVAAGPLHAPDFQLVVPTGVVLSRARYLGGIASGRLHYVEWTPDTIAVRLYEHAAVIRYSSRLVMVVAQADTIRPYRHWHMDLWEERAGGWQVVWSQATAIQP